MRAVRLQEFLSLPENTLYARLMDGVDFSGFEVKGETISDDDWWFSFISPSSFEALSDDDDADIDSINDGVSTGMAFSNESMNSVVYADLGEEELEDIRFLIFDNVDIRNAISVMINCIK